MNYNGKPYNIVTRSNELLGGHDSQYGYSNKYPLPIKAYTLQTGKTIVYDSVNGAAKANKIYDTDLCTITKLYENGWCYVAFPLDAGGADSGYVRTAVFFDFDVDSRARKSNNQITTYSRSNLMSIIGYVGANDEVYLIAETDFAVQVLYPLAVGGYKLGWITKENADNLLLIVNFIPGDINGDDIVNNKDLTRLMKYLAGENVNVNEAVLDVNGDSTVNNKDLTRLMRYLAGESVNIF